MAAYYRNGGLPPCVAATAGVGDKAQLSPNSSPTQSSYPKAQYENPARFGQYGNPPTVPHTTVTDVTDETGTLPLSPQPQQSQSSNTAISNAAPTVRHSIVYVRPLSTPTQTDPPTSSIHGTPAHHHGGAVPNAQTYATQTSSLSSPTHGAHSFYRGGQANTVTYNAAPKRPGNAEASGPAQGPAYSGGPHREAEHVEASGSAHNSPPYTGEPYNANDSPPLPPRKNLNVPKRAALHKPPRTPLALTAQTTCPRKDLNIPMRVALHQPLRTLVVPPAQTSIPRVRTKSKLFRPLGIMSERKGY